MTEQSGPTPVEPDLTLETEDQVTSGAVAASAVG